MDNEKESILSIIRSRYWREKITYTLLATLFVIIGTTAATVYPEPDCYITLSLPLLFFFGYMLMLYIDVRTFGMRLIGARRRGGRRYPNNETG